MRLTTKIISVTTIVLFIVILLWSALFYFRIINEINDETDDALDLYSEQLITKALAQKQMPASTNASNNTYSFTKITREEAKAHAHVLYYDKMLYIPDKLETEPARILETVFEDATGEYYLLRVYTPTIEKADLKKSILLSVVILFGGLVLFLILTNWLIVRGFLKPLDKLMKWLDNYSIEKEPVKLELHSSTKEFKKLYEAIHKSTTRSSQFFKTQKEFIDNASHEMQTPIAICKNRLEILAQEEDLTEKQLTEIAKIQNTLGEMIKLNKALLLLSKIENGQFQQKAQITFNPAIVAQTEDLAQLYESKKLIVTIEQKGDFTLIIDEVLANTITGNLLRNAFIHSNQNGSIHIMITPHFIDISNSSLSGDLSDKNIFNRFVKGDGNKQSIGLGLSIVKAICTLYNLKIDYFYKNNNHHFKLFNNKT